MHTESDLFTQISGRNFLPESKLRAVPFALQNKAHFEGQKGAKCCRERAGRRVPGNFELSDPTEIPPPPHRETSVAIPLWHCVFCGIADYRCYTPLLSLKTAYRNQKTGLTGGVSQKKLASEAYRAIGGVTRNSIANRAIVGH